MSNLTGKDLVILDALNSVGATHAVALINRLQRQIGDLQRQVGRLQASAGRRRALRLHGGGPRASGEPSAEEAEALAWIRARTGPVWTVAELTEAPPGYARADGGIEGRRLGWLAARYCRLDRVDNTGRRYWRWV